MTALVREWIIFAVCLGIGGHVALGLVLHAPERPWGQAGTYGIYGGLAVYVVVQVCRWIWTYARSKPLSG